MLRLAGHGGSDTGFSVLLLLSLTPGRGFLLGPIENHAGDALELGADVEHALDAAVIFVCAENVEEAHNVIHELQIGACAAVLWVLEDVREERHECGNRIV